MSIEYGFFDSEIIGEDEHGLPVYDRVKDAAFMAGFFRGIFGNGVVNTIGSDCAVSCAGGMAVKINAGCCWINGRQLRIYNASDEDIEKLTLAPSSLVLPRIDRIIARLDLVNRTIGLMVLKGADASTPVAPALTRNQDTHDLCLAQIRVDSGVSEIVAAKITDTRADETLCGFVKFNGYNPLNISPSPNLPDTFYYGDTPAPTGTRLLNYSGYLRATRILNAVYNDVAERFPCQGEYAPGTVVVMGDDGNVVPCDTFADTRVVGVVSDSYGLLLGSEGAPIALCGRVPVLVDCACKIGDTLVSSSKRGHATVDNRASIGEVIGKVIQITDNEVIALIR